ncbi:uncharacterized protein LOC135831685 isoform X2 [Planococcus citri]|uniref:uncharacterized protein LOC135831685 isoform X2 n=1 Tax=Planococcus citri TaxID=170843 RepID=UPI0031F7D818
MKSNIATNVLFVLLAFNGRSNPSILAATEQIHDTFSFLCQDQMVKVDSNIYHLDRLNSSLKSEYFEKVFTSEDFKQKNDPILEIKPLNSEEFPTILDIIHGKEVYDVLNKDNYLSLLKELNHFGMRIDLQIFSSLIDRDLESCSPQEAKIFELYAFIIQNSQFEYLSRSVLKYLSNHSDVLQNHEILSSNVPFDHLVRLIKNLKHADENTRYNVFQICSEWLCHDMKNRLPHMAQLVKKIKLLYRVSEEMYSDFSKCLPSCDLDKQARRKMISTCLFAQVANGGKLHPTTPEDCYNYDSYARYSPDDSSDESETETMVHERYVNDRNDSVKLNEFRKNGDLYDITVRVGEKTYKLHRHVLELKSGYFRDIFQAEYAEAITQCGGTPVTCPSKDKEYLLSDEIDPSTFEDVISYLYGYENLNAIFKRFEYKWDKIAKFLKIVHSLRLDELLQDCIRNLKKDHQRANSQDVEQILNFVHEKSEYENLYVIHLSKHLKATWPNIHNMPQFCSISLSVLKKMLNSSYFRFDDPHKILDICSKWTCHDVKGRYQFLPQIAGVINPLCVVEDDEYRADAVAEFNPSPERFVRDKLWKILSSLPYTIYSGKNFKNMSKKLEEIPTFISLTGYEINVLNVDLNVIVSINDSEPMHSLWGISAQRNDPLLATLIHDNLFILYSFNDSIKFQVYNFFLKTCTQLRCDLPRSQMIFYHFYTLLNCNNKIYSCSNHGRIAQYSMEFDLWTTLIKHDPQSYKANLYYTSDGKTLYRMYEIPGKDRYSSSSQYVVEEFDLRKNSWNRVTGSPLMNLIPDPTIFSNKWRWSYREVPKKSVLCFAQYEDRLLVLTHEEIYCYYPINGSFEFKTAIPKAIYSFGTHIVAIDKHL